APILGYMFRGIAMPGIAGAVKFELVLIGAAVSIIAYGIKNVVKGRRDPFCIHCGYSLTGLADGGVCPECGRRFKLILSEEFKRDPDFFIERHKAARIAPASPPAFLAGDGPTG